MRRPKSKNHLKNLEKERDRQTETEENHKKNTKAVSYKNCSIHLPHDQKRK